ncbi:hypothetical protein RJ641_013300 [Dillenia turbinata]|uniref:Uncharacterized protein n=1 Tax=Dillenia turbinata TaxID=194707 RepID=A0AAN8WBU1_9MAGN
MLKSAKILHHKGFHTTFVNTEYNHNRFLNSRRPHSLDGLPDFHFAAIPNGLPPTDVLCHAGFEGLMLQYTGAVLIGPIQEASPKPQCREVPCSAGNVWLVVIVAPEL